MDERPVLELRGITKRFPGIVANDNVDFDLRKGEVHALLGENGAGKSTLMNVLYGLYRPDEGEILINGKPAELGSPKASIENGVGMVHQHFMLIPVMTVAENIVLATEPVHNGVLLDYSVAEKRVAEISTRFRAASRSSEPANPVASSPSITFSATVKTGISMKCWCTMPMPAAMASPGPVKRCTSSSSRISPSSAR